MAIIWQQGLFGELKSHVNWYNKNKGGVAMAISSIGSQAVTQTSDIQKTDPAEMMKNRPKMAPARSEEAFTVNISDEAQKKAQENAKQASMATQPQNKPLM
jgi:hypothetical protein